MGSDCVTYLEVCQCTGDLRCVRVFQEEFRVSMSFRDNDHPPNTKRASWTNTSGGRKRQLGRGVEWANASTGQARRGPRGRVRSIEERINQLP